MELYYNGAMLNLYYKIWADTINYERNKNGGMNHWQTFTFAYMSFFLALNILALLSAILFFTGVNLTSTLMDKIMLIVSGEAISNIIWSILVIFLPSMCITYFLVFYKKKYKYILEPYKFQNGKYLLIYFCLTVMAVFGFSLLNKLGNLPELMDF